MELKFKEKITKKIIFVTFIAMIFAFIFALSSFFFKPRFKTEILLEPVKIESLGSQLSSITGGLGSIGQLAGFDLSSLGGDDRELSEVAQANLLSRDFFKEHLYEKFLPYLYAVDYYDKGTKLIVFDEAYYDAESFIWVERTIPKFISSVTGSVYDPKPSLELAYKKFYRDYFSIDEDVKTGFVSLSVNHESPVIAKDWAEYILISINEYLRREDSENYKQIIDLLQEEQKKVQLESVQETLSKLLESQTATYYLTNTSKYYVYRPIEKPYEAEKKYFPSRTIFLILGFLFGLALGVIYTFRKNILSRLLDD
tara:strand:+ start:62 stop:997 length:936 start_codon:yes stop_codon:yes gene_type:complete